MKVWFFSGLLSFFYFLTLQANFLFNISPINFGVQAITVAKNSTTTISSPGTYFLGRDISFSPSATSALLKITSSNVYINLNGHTLYLPTGFDQNISVNAIEIANNLSNIVIESGSITAITNDGVIIGQGTSNIHLKNLQINKCNHAGIYFNGTSGAPIINTSVKNCTITQCQGGGTADGIGLLLNYCYFSTFAQSSFNFNQGTAATKNGYGVYATNCLDNTFQTCVADGQRGNYVSAGFFIGTGCSGFTFKSCKSFNSVSQATNTSGVAYGFITASNVDNTFFENCTSGEHTAFYRAAGFYTINGDNSRFIKCTGYGNSVTGTSTDGGYGFLCSDGTNLSNLYEDCVAYGNSGTTDTDTATKGHGFYLKNASRCILSNCRAFANNGGLGMGAGIHINSDSHYCIVEKCSTNSNTSSTSNQAFGIIDTNSSSTNLLIQNFSFANRDTSVSPITNNYSTIYSLVNCVQEVTKDSIGLITTSDKNISIIP